MFHVPRKGIHFSYKSTFPCRSPTFVTQSEKVLDNAPINIACFISSTINVFLFVRTLSWRSISRAVLLVTAVLRVFVVCDGAHTLQIRADCGPVWVAVLGWKGTIGHSHYFSLIRDWGRRLDEINQTMAQVLTWATVTYFSTVVLLWVLRWLTKGYSRHRPKKKSFIEQSNQEMV